MMSFSEPDESAAASNTTVSLPKPVVIVSKPPSPSILSIPSPELIISLPAPPKRVSLELMVKVV
jgi:hypothetical protein